MIEILRQIALLSVGFSAGWIIADIIKIVITRKAANTLKPPSIDGYIDLTDLHDIEQTENEVYETNKKFSW